jgi:hypothetical protein
MRSASPSSRWGEKNRTNVRRAGDANGNGRSACLAPMRSRITTVLTSPDLHSGAAKVRSIVRSPMADRRVPYGGRSNGAMPTKDGRVDAYIEKAADFARPLLIELRRRVHASCPEVVETLKWRMPSFEYQGLLGGMAAFKQHCVFGFWKHELMIREDPKRNEAMGSFGCLKTLKDLPTKSEFARLVKRAMELNEQGVKAPRTKTAKKKPLAMHPQFAAALAKSAKARATLDGFPPSAQREYLEWIGDAKGDDTRARRIEQAVAWLAEGKRRHWKYEKC